MQNIKSEGTKPERLIINRLAEAGVNFTLYEKKLAGRPDIVIWDKKIAVFIDSDFWHGHPSRFVMPKVNVEYWTKKIANNKKRDRKVNKELRQQGWTVIRLWEYDIYKNTKSAVNKILRAVSLNGPE